MKILLIILATILYIDTYVQAQNNTNRIKPSRNNTGTPATGVQQNNKVNPVNPQQVKPVSGSATRGNIRTGTTGNQRTTTRPSGNTTGNTSNNRSNNNRDSSSPFVGGIYPATGAEKIYDTIQPGDHLITEQNNNTIIPGGNDTTFNANTIREGNIPTNSGAVDKSGQAQFGQTNWGKSRVTIGESQWTVPPPITASFSKEFPAANDAVWSRNNVDTTIYSARYRSGANWVTSNYNAAGQRLDMRTEIALLQPPRAVSVFIAKQPANFQPTAIYLLQMQGRQDIYELRTSNGKSIYINNAGMEVSH